MKSINRFFIVFLVIGLFSVNLSHAEKANEAKMASEALKPFTPRDEIERVAHVQKMREKVDSRSIIEPNVVGSASVVFTSGKSVAEVAEISTKLGLEVSRIELKVPRGDRGTILSMAIGSDDLVKREGNFQSRAERSIAVLRHDLVQTAMLMPDDEQAEWMEAMHTPFLIYSIEAIGKMNKLRKLLDRQDIAVVVPHEDDGKLKLHALLKSKYERARLVRSELGRQT